MGWAGMVFCRNILLCVRGRDLFGAEGAGDLAVMRLAPIAVLQKHPSFLTVWTLSLFSVWVKVF